MNNYQLTAFHADGKKILDESIQAHDDSKAKEKGLNLLTQKDLLNVTYRLVTSKGKLLLFHS